MRPEVLPPHAAVPPYGPAALSLARYVAQRLPATLVRVWAESGGGTLLVADEEAPRFQAGLVYWRDVASYGALFLPPACEPLPLWLTVGTWLDVLGGSLGGDARLSQGAGATPALRAAAARLADIFALGYAAAFLGRHEPPALFAQAIAAYQTNPLALSAADPHLTRWLRGTLLEEGFWRRVAGEMGAMDDKLP